MVCIADDSDDQHSNHTSDTESVNAYPSRRRLRLMWDPNLDMQRQAWHPEARSVESLFRQLASRIGSVPERAPIPRPLRQQRWSPVIVPILWAAAGSSESTPAAYDFLMSLASRIRDPVEFHDNRLTAVDALRTGWVSLRAVLRTWGIQEREHLTAHLRRQGFPATQPGNHISARAQEALLSEACQVDARVALVEVVCMNVAICLGREVVVPEVARPHHEGIPVRHQRQREAAQESSWHQFDQLNLEDCFLTKVPTLRKCPHFLRGRLREVFSFVLRERCRAKMENDVEGEVRAWKLFGLIPAMLLHRPKGVGSVGRAELVHRFNDFQQGHWEQLWHRAQAAASARFSRAPTSGATEKEDHRRRGRAAQSRVQQGQVSRARQELTGAPLAPRNEDTLQQLRNRPPQEQLRAVPSEVLEFQPSREFTMDAKLFAECLRSALSGCSPGPGGCSNEILKVCLDDYEGLKLLLSAAEDFAKAAVPDNVFKAFMVARMTASQKSDGGIRGIATGTVFRRLVAKTLARQFGTVVEGACSPFQFALSTRAGVDCVGHTVRAATEANPRMTVLSVDGIGAF